jgi:hypothetical protein
MQGVPFLRQFVNGERQMLFRLLRLSSVGLVFKADDFKMLADLV